MTADIWVKLIEQAPFLAANILLVWIFVRYNERRDEEWRKTLESMDKRHSEGTGRLAEEVKGLRAEMHEHDTYVRENFASVRPKGAIR